MSQHDEVNHPKHYDVAPGLEAYDVIKAVLTPEELRGYCLGNLLKYRLRAGEKGPADTCIAKANWYRDKLRELDAGEYEREKRAFVRAATTIFGPPCDCGFTAYSSCWDGLKCRNCGAIKEAYVPQP